MLSGQRSDPRNKGPLFSGEARGGRAVGEGQEMNKGLQTPVAGKSPQLPTGNPVTPVRKIRMWLFASTLLRAA